MLPVQEAPEYPPTQAHCDDSQTVLASTSVHLEVNVHTMPTTAERDFGTSEVYNTLYYMTFWLL